MKKITILITLISLIVLVSCEKTLKFDSKYQKPRLVVNTLVLKDSLIKVDISTSRSILDDAGIADVSGATVKLYKNDSYLETINEVNGKYISTHQAEEGATYSIEASANGFKTVSGEAKVPYRVPILSLDTSSIINEYNSKRLEFSLKFPVQTYRDEYFLLRCRLNSSPQQYNDPYPRPSYVFIETKDIIAEGEGGSEILFSNRLIDTDSYTFKGDISPYIRDTSYIVFELFSLNKDMYDYFITLDMHQYARGDFMMEPAIVYSNTSNGMGIVGGGAVSVDSIQVMPIPFMN